MCLEIMKVVMKTLLCCCVVWLISHANADLTKDLWKPDDAGHDADEVVLDYYSDKQKSHDQQNQDKCTTKECNLLKESILSMMNKRAKPCDDMYSYSCGGLLEKERKRDPERVMSTFRQLIDAQTKKLIKIVEGLKGRKKNDAYKKVLDWYSACKNTKEKEKLGPSPLLNLLKESGPWPVLDDYWDRERWDLEGTLAFINRKLALFPLFELTMDNDPRNESKSPYGLGITNPELGLKATEFYLKKTKYSDKILFAYFQLLLKLNELMGARSTYVEGLECDLSAQPFFDLILGCKAELKKDISNVVLLEMDIAKAKSLEKGTYLVSPYTTLGSLQKAYVNKGFDWKRYISLVYQDIPTQQPFTDDEVIYIDHPEAFKALMLLIETTDTRILANYIMSKVLFEWGGSLSPEFREPYKKFYAAAYGIKTFSALDVRCIHSVKKDLMFPVTALFVKDNLPEKDLVKAEKLVNRLTEAYLLHLDHNVQWMDNKTRKAAKKKVMSMLAHVGYPRKIRNMTVLDELYKNIKVDPLKYFENVLLLNQFELEKSLNRRGTYPKRDRWNMELTTANAQYSAQKNMITVGAGLLQPPLFHLNYPRARTFGSIGMAIGHEMTHGFDAYGSRFDEKGNLHQWWTNKTRKTFLTKTKCMIEEYSKFKVYNEHLKGKQTLDENIADNGGLRIAYEAYSTSLQFDGPDQVLPGIELTPKQLFFLSYSQIWCKHTPRASAINSLHTDVHSPAKARVNIVLQNMKEFSDTFKCPIGAPMNPKKKCIVW